MAAFVISFFTPAILTKIYFKSFSKGLMIFVLNFSLAVVRTKAAIAALLRIDPATQWGKRIAGKPFDALYAIRKTSYEILFSVILFAFGAVVCPNESA